MADLNKLFKDEEHAILYQEIQKVKDITWRIKLNFATTLSALVCAIVALVRSV